jgi:hypothetical protein
MKPKTLLRFVVILTISVVSVFYLSFAQKASAERIKLQEEVSQQSLAEEGSNNDFIFFGSISRFFVVSLGK